MTEIAPAIVYVVDDEPTIHQGLDSLLRSVGYVVHCFGSADAFLEFERPANPSCLLLDIRMVGKSGLDLQDILCERGDAIPIIFLTAHGDVPLSVRAMKAGALDVLLKPFHEQTLLDAVLSGIERDLTLTSASAKATEFVSLFETLTRREAEILRFVAEGLSSKEIAFRLSLKEITIKVHRAAAMRKIRCRSVIDLVTKLSNLPSSKRQNSRF